MPFLSICLESQASAIACCQFFSLLREIGGNPVILIVDEATSILSDFSRLKISRLVCVRIYVPACLPTVV